MARPRERPRPRIRRSPEEARELILGATRQLLRERAPDAIGLKDVARAAGVSHALVTHYFGTIDALVDAALETLAEANRHELVRRVLGRADEGPRAWMEQWFEWVTRPEAPRLLAWSFLTGKTTRADFFSRRTRGLSKFADLMQQRFAGELDVSREDIEFILLLLMAAPFGYAIGRAGFWSGLGKDKPGPEEDAMFFGRLADLVERLIEDRRLPARALERRRRGR